MVLELCLSMQRIYDTLTNVVEHLEMRLQSSLFQDVDGDSVTGRTSFNGEITFPLMNFLALGKKNHKLKVFCLSRS